ncbi:MAG TPA: DOMON domain-containing protein [Methanospirillum sp.]|uniref:DOMON domain-containing protein n=1 Tax=Methanospirillum sp. TaxID=45200 RepID=UPI002BFCF1BD|nr:DOMON domain-containing protein [Methanospirillum sp.]HOJ96635.1 DOMON domain-containing protein [Methanospirillum sp.]HOL40690.1 DOMON domain-containing protein [Methanospirillum sp.]HPP77347.1 DOMON domain-containing protein [Methanospirillum sp.]
MNSHTPIASLLIMVCMILGSSAADVELNGVIGDTEYDHNASFDNGNYQIFWTIDNDIIYIGLLGKTTGWVGIGLKPSQMMKDADIILAGVADGTVYWADSFSTGNFGPHPPDTDLGGTDDIMNLSATEALGVTTVEFARKLNTGDAYDAVLTAKEEVPFIWAMATDDDPQFKHNTPKGKGTITL